MVLSKMHAHTHAKHIGTATYIAGLFPPYLQHPNLRPAFITGTGGLNTYRAWLGRQPKILALKAWNPLVAGFKLALFD